MIEALKGDELVKRIGGSFRLTALVQRRLKELVEGARPLVDTRGRTLVEVAVEEIAQEKIGIDYEASPLLHAVDREMMAKTLHGYDNREARIGLQE